MKELIERYSKVSKRVKGISKILDSFIESVDISSLGDSDYQNRKVIMDVYRTASTVSWSLPDRSPNKYLVVSLWYLLAGLVGDLPEDDSIKNSKLYIQMARNYKLALKNR